MSKSNKEPASKLISLILGLTLVFTQLNTSLLGSALAGWGINPQPQSQGPELPQGLILKTTPYQPLSLKGLKVYTDNPLKFDFLLDEGNTTLSKEELKQESRKLIEYFLACLTLPEDELWVNLSPFEKDKIIPEETGLTEMGKGLLEQDYLLKKLTASLMYPETELGQEFWQKVYQRAYQLFKTTKLPVNTFNKVWIIPDKAVVYEDGDRVVIGENHLKVMLESDYLALKNRGQGSKNLSEKDAKNINDFSSQIVKEVIIPAIEEEVNSGQNFATLRQMYSSFILATWFKKRLKQSLLGQVYVDKKKVAGIDTNDPGLKESIYQQYLSSYKDGIYNYIKSDYSAYERKNIKRRYYSGGIEVRIGDGLKIEGPLGTNRVLVPGDKYFTALTTTFSPINPTPKPPFQAGSPIEFLEQEVILTDAITTIRMRELLTIWGKLWELFDKAPQALRELKQKANDPKYEFSNPLMKDNLLKEGILNNEGSLVEPIKTIINLSVQIKDKHLFLISPTVQMPTELLRDKAEFFKRVGSPLKINPENVTVKEVVEKIVKVYLSQPLSVVYSAGESKGLLEGKGSNAYLVEDVLDVLSGKTSFGKAKVKFQEEFQLFCLIPAQVVLENPDLNISLDAKISLITLIGKYLNLKIKKEEFDEEVVKTLRPDEKKDAVLNILDSVLDRADRLALALRRWREPSDSRIKELLQKVYNLSEERIVQAIEYIQGRARFTDDSDFFPGWSLRKATPYSDRKIIAESWRQAVRQVIEYLFPDSEISYIEKYIIRKKTEGTDFFLTSAMESYNSSEWLHGILVESLRLTDGQMRILFQEGEEPKASSSLTKGGINFLDEKFFKLDTRGKGMDISYDPARLQDFDLSGLTIGEIVEVNPQKN